jgi:hypothetical protein
MTSETTARALTATDLRAGIWRVVPQASSATFSVHDKILLTVHGMLPIRSGIAVLDPDGGLHEARVELDAAGIDTGNERRDRDLAKPGLLNYTTYPTVVVTTGPATLGPTGGTWPPPSELAALTAQSACTPFPSNGPSKTSGSMCTAASTGQACECGCRGS